jgi:hypothetical protein
MHCEAKKPNFNVHPSREIGVFPTLEEGRDYFYAHPMRLFRTIEVHSKTMKDIKSAFVKFEDASGDGIHDYTVAGTSETRTPALSSDARGSTNDPPHLIPGPAFGSCWFFLPQVGDWLYFYDTPTIKGIYSQGSGLLKIKGRDTPQAYQDAIREIG